MANIALAEKMFASLFIFFVGAAASSSTSAPCPLDGATSAHSLVQKNIQAANRALDDDPTSGAALVEEQAVTDAEDTFEVSSLVEAGKGGAVQLEEQELTGNEYASEATNKMEPSNDDVSVEFYAGSNDATPLLVLANASYTSVKMDNGFMHLKVPADASNDLKQLYTKLTVANSFTSQVHQDESIRDLFSDEDNNDQPHFFLDLAANHPLNISNTFHLEHALGWKGLLVEANPEYWSKYWTRKNLLIGAVVSSQDDADIAFEMRGIFGGVVGDEFDNKNATSNSVHYRTVTLRTLLQKYRAPKTIDYFSLDVEGGESDVMKGIPLCKISDGTDSGCYRIRALTVERPNKSLRYQLSQSLVYIGDHGDFGDQLWVEPSLVETAAKLQHLTPNRKENETL
jgi:hypothetical protein